MKNGFTLIELSIVLIIIGLIIGGVLVGQDMIKSAEIRSTLQQIEKYNTAVNTFRGKYSGIPGDLVADKAASYGMQTRSGANGHGDGDGLLEGCFSGGQVGGCENLLFWRDLSFANLTEGSFNSAVDDYSAGGGVSVLAADLPLYIPPAKIGRDNFFIVYAENGINYYELSGINRILGDGSGYVLRLSLTPAEAFNMDAKIDDGLPGTGTVIALSNTDETGSAGAAVPAAPAASVCVSDALTPNPYNTGTSDFANSPACQLRFRFN